jgi:hypothetical protein
VLLQCPKRIFVFCRCIRIALSQDEQVIRVVLGVEVWKNFYVVKALKYLEFV